MTVEKMPRWDKDSNYFTCAICGQVHMKGWSDEEAIAEARKNFGDMAPAEDEDLDNADLVAVCDKCYHELAFQMIMEDFDESL